MRRKILCNLLTEKLSDNKYINELKCHGGEVVDTPIPENLVM